MARDRLEAAVWWRGSRDLAASHWLLPPAADDLPEQRLLAGELAERVRAAVASLPPAQREVVILGDIDGWAADEVCRLLELSQANQRVLLHRGRSRVRAALGSYLARERAALASARDFGANAVSMLAADAGR